MVLQTMQNPWVCLECGARQEASGPCQACRRDDTLDARDEKVRDLMSDVERRLADSRELRIRLLSVVAAMVITVGLWAVPGFWSYRAQMFALPMLFDQWIFMAALGIGIYKGGQHMFKSTRFPYLDELTS